MTLRIVIAAVLLAAFFAFGQSESELDALMKDVGKANGGVKKGPDNSSKAKDAQVIAKLLKDSEAFWVKNGKTDAVEWSQQGHKGATDLAAAFAADNAEGIAAASKVMGASCQACHKVYRERLPDGSYKLKM